jgi:hypothetical protein
LKSRLPFILLCASLGAQIASADVILSLFPDNNPNPTAPLTLQGTNGESKQIGFRIDNNTNFYLLFNSYILPPAPGIWNDSFSTLLQNGDFIAPNDSFSGLFGTYTFPLTGTGVVTTHSFSVTYLAFADPQDEIEQDLLTAVDSLGNDPSVRFLIVPSTEPPVDPIPEPSTLMLCAAAVACLALRQRNG